jgi:hypothetical protein
MNIIDFLMNNFFIFIVIAGFLINLLKKYNGEAQENKKQRRPMETKPVIDVRSEVDEAKKFQKQASAVMSKVEVAKKVKNPGPALSDIQKDSVLLQPNVNRGKRRANSFSISKKQVVQGIIWSEILAPPKAKRK